MGPPVNVRSIDGLRQFRVHLHEYVAETVPAIDGVTNDVQRTMCWLREHQLPNWRKQIVKQREQVRQAEADLFGARLGSSQEAIAICKRRLDVAKTQLEAAEQGLRRTHRWLAEFESKSEIYLRQTRMLRTYLTDDLKKADVTLGQLLERLDRYTEVPQPTLHMHRPPPESPTLQ